MPFQESLTRRQIALRFPILSPECFFGGSHGVTNLAPTTTKVYCFFAMLSNLTVPQEGVAKHPSSSFPRELPDFASSIVFDQRIN